MLAAQLGAAADSAASVPVPFRWPRPTRIGLRLLGSPWGPPRRRGGLLPTRAWRTALRRPARGRGLRWWSVAGQRLSQRFAGEELGALLWGDRAGRRSWRGWFLRVRTCGGGSHLAAVRGVSTGRRWWYRRAGRVGRGTLRPRWRRRLASPVRRGWQGRDALCWPGRLIDGGRNVLRCILSGLHVAVRGCSLALNVGFGGLPWLRSRLGLAYGLSPRPASRLTPRAADLAYRGVDVVPTARWVILLILCSKSARRVHRCCWWRYLTCCCTVRRICLRVAVFVASAVVQCVEESLISGLSHVAPALLPILAGEHLKGSSNR